MKINLLYSAFDLIMKTTKPFIYRGSDRPVFTQILLDSRDGTVTATALDGAKMVRLTVAAESGTEDGQMLIPWMRPIGKNCLYAQITDDGKNITVETDASVLSFKKVVGEYADVRRLFNGNKEPTATVWCDPKQLATALSTFSDKVKIDFYTPLSGLVISDAVCRQDAVVMPVRPPETV